MYQYECIVHLKDGKTVRHICETAYRACVWWEEQKINYGDNVDSVEIKKVKPWEMKQNGN